ncbi:MAG TPA: hypothetical protein VHE55_08665 [Fimbriimonadaceae bacterium]|nr:hypothetical protein [Fimbriimonadaceae bacterium]
MQRIGSPGFAHLLLCGECRRHLMADREIAAAARRMRISPVPAADAGLPDAMRAGSTLPASRKASPWRWAVAGLAACAVLAAVAPYLLGSGPVRRGPNVAMTAQSGTIEPLAPHGPGLHRQSPAAGPRNGPGERGHLHAPVARKDEPAVPDRDFLNPGRMGTAIAFETGNRPGKLSLPPMRDDFAVPAQMLMAWDMTPDDYASLSADMKKLYEQERQVTDSRLYKAVTLSLKHASFDEVCQALSRQTGVEMMAGPNVADDNATILVSSRPAREVMREISRVFGVVWERSGEDGAYSYVLKQDTAAQIAEQKIRNEDVSQSIQALDRKMRSVSEQADPQIAAARDVFENLSLEELDTIRSGETLSLWSRDIPTRGILGKTALLDARLADEVLGAMGGIRPVLDGFLPSPSASGRNVIPYTQLKDPQAYLYLTIQTTEFGGAHLRVLVGASGVTPNGQRAGAGMPKDIGSVPGPGEAPLHNAIDNASVKDAADMRASFVFDPKPTTPVDEQGHDPDGQPEGTITERIGSYRTRDDMQPPRPFMTTDDFWEAVHEKTRKDVVADSFSRLIPLRTYRGSLFDTLSKWADGAHVHWRQDEGFLTGRSATYQWQRLNEVPKRTLTKWQEERKAKGYLSLRSVLAMAQLTDRQLDALEVGRTIVNQWRLPEWGIPSRPYWQVQPQMVRQICRFLANLPDDQLVLFEQGTFPGNRMPPATLEYLNVIGAGLGPSFPAGTLLGVDYVPPGKYYWCPVFKEGEEPVRTDLIVGDTREQVLAEVHRRFPDHKGDETAYSDGFLGLLVRRPDSAQDVGDQRFWVSPRQAGGSSK